MASAVVADAPAPEGTVSVEDLFLMHADYVWTSLRRLGIPEADLEDLTHEVFLQVHARLADYDPARPAKPWLFGFAFRIASQYRRRAHRRYETHGEPDVARDPALPADEKLAADDDRRMVVAALEGIDLDRRAVFVLFEIDREPMDWIAASLGIPVNTAYSRLRVARDEFRAAVRRIQLRGGRP